MNDTMSLELKLRAFILASEIVGSIPPTPCIKKERKVVNDHMFGLVSHPYVLEEMRKLIKEAHRLEGASR